MRKLLTAACLVLLIAQTCVQAQTQSAVADAAGTNPALEKHVLAVSEQLRCLVCQNQTIADSHADLAVDLRNQVREKIQQGQTDQEIFDYMVARYGDFVMYRPPLHISTVLLWFGPFLLLFGGLFFLAKKLRGRRSEEPELSEAELRRSKQLLATLSESSSDNKEMP